MRADNLGLTQKLKISSRTSTWDWWMRVLLQNAQKLISYPFVFIHIFILMHALCACFLTKAFQSLVITF